MPKINYTCKRKRDYITTFAVLMFIGIVVFEIYLVVILPIQLNRRNAMKDYVAKQRMMESADSLRDTMRSIKTKSRIQDGEVALGISCMDILALYTRTNQEYLTAEQVYQLNGMLNKFWYLATRWQNGAYIIQTERFDATPVFQRMENALDETQKSHAK